MRTLSGHQQVSRAICNRFSRRHTTVGKPTSRMPLACTIPNVLVFRNPEKERAQPARRRWRYAAGCARCARRRCCRALDTSQGRARRTHCPAWLVLSSRWLAPKPPSSISSGWCRPGRKFDRVGHRVIGAVSVRVVVVVVGLAAGCVIVLTCRRLRMRTRICVFVLGGCVCACCCCCCLLRLSSRLQAGVAWLAELRLGLWFVVVGLPRAVVLFSPAAGFVCVHVCGVRVGWLCVCACSYVM